MAIPYLTEEEAKKKACCVYQDRFHNCLASKCMGWRWKDEIHPEINDYFLGYCGLAGA